MRLRQLMALSAAVAVFAFPAAAFAQDQCSDILRGGTFSQASFQSNNYLRQIAYSHLRTASYDQRNRAQVLGATVPVGDIIVGANASEQSYRAFQRSLDDERFQSIESNSYNSVAVSSGDPNITQEWGKCMSGQSGLVVRFEPISNTRSHLFMRWAKPATMVSAPDHMTLDQDVALTPGATLEDENWRSCIGRGARITTAGCSVIVVHPDNRIPITATINDDEGHGYAKVAPRVRAEVVRQTLHPALTADILARGTYNTTRSFIRTFPLPPELASQGWTFVPGNYPVHAYEVVGPRVQCAPNPSGEIQNRVSSAVATETELTLDGRQDNNARNNAGCRFTVSPTIQRLELQNAYPN